MRIVVFASAIAVGVAGGSSAAFAGPAGSFDLSASLRRGVSWDLEVNLGLPVQGDRWEQGPLFVRVKAGVLLVHEPWLLTTDAVGELGGVRPAAGVNVCVTHLWTGLWGGLGATMGGDARPILSLGAGWSIFGVEWQKEFASGAAGPAVLLVLLRAPFGIAAFMLR